MVNQDIVNYLEEGKKRGFSMQVLRGKLIEGGFDEMDVEEAIASMSVPSSEEGYRIISGPDKMPIGEAQQKRELPGEQTNPDKVDSLMGDPGKERKEIGIQQKSEARVVQPAKAGSLGSQGKWMKVGAMLGITLIAIYVAIGITWLMVPDFIEDILESTLALFAISIIIVLLTALNYYAFVRLGKKTNVKLISLGSWFIIIPVIIYLALVIAGNLFVYEQAVNFYAGVDSSDSYKITFLVLSIVWVVALLLHVVGTILLGIGLYKARKEIGILKVAGVLNILVFVAGIGFLVGIILLVYSILNDFSTVAPGSVDLTDLMENAVIAMWSLMALVGLKVVARIFEIVGLFKASKKFE